jgi:flagellar hook-length control protein FliK
LLAQLTQGLSAEQQANLLSQWGQQLSEDERNELIGRFAEWLSDDDRAAMLAELSARLPANEQAEVLAGLTQQIAAAGSEQSSAAVSTALEQVYRALRSDTPLLNDRFGLGGRFGQPLTSSPEQPGAATADLLRSIADASATTNAMREQAPASAAFRDALLAMLAARNNAAEQRSPLGQGDVLSQQQGAVSGNNPALYGAATPTASATTPSISAPLNSPAWAQQLGQQLVMINQRGGEQRVEIRLHPPELGPLAVSLRVVDQSTQIQFLAANPQVRAAVEQAIPQLREALAEQGINLGETSVGEQQQGSERGFDGTAEGERSASGWGVAGTNDETVLESATESEIRLDGRVDLYA